MCKYDKIYNRPKNKPFNDCYFYVEAKKVNNKIITIIIETQKVNKIVM